MFSKLANWKFLTGIASFALSVTPHAFAQAQPQDGIGQVSSAPAVKCFRLDRRHVAQSANFNVYSADSAAVARRTAQCAEMTLAELATRWFGRVNEKLWAPRCQIVLHRGRSEYRAAVGAGSEGTRGSSAVTFDEGKITGRRIDLLDMDQDRLASVLPHELTHVLLRDRFAQGTLPRWADEGMAMLADTEEKRAQHLHDLRTAMAKSDEFLAADLLTMGYPPSSRRQCFYGQSVFLTQFLVARKDPQHFIKFVEGAGIAGFDIALRECYAIADVAQLDRQWRRNIYSFHLTSTAPSR